MNTNLKKIQKALSGNESGNTISEQAQVILNIITGNTEEFKLGEMITLSYHDFQGVSSSSTFTFNGLFTGDEFLLVLAKPQNTSFVELGLCAIMNSSTSGVYYPVQKNSDNVTPTIKSYYQNSNIIVTASGKWSWCRVLVIRVPGLLT